MDNLFLMLVYVFPLLVLLTIGAWWADRMLEKDIKEAQLNYEKLTKKSKLSTRKKTQG